MAVSDPGVPIIQDSVRDLNKILDSFALPQSRVGWSWAGLCDAVDGMIVSVLAALGDDSIDNFNLAPDGAPLIPALEVVPRHQDAIYSAMRLSVLAPSVVTSPFRRHPCHEPR